MAARARTSKFRRRARAALASAVTVALVAGCGGGDGGGGSADGDVTITWWHNGNNEPLRGYWEQVAADFEAENEGVTIEISALQNEDLRSRLTAALQSNDPPDLFQQWGGGEMAQQVESGLLMDLTDELPEQIESVGSSIGGWQLEDRVYGMPWSLGVVGFWYNTALFEQAGVEPPTTVEDLLTAVEDLKAADIVPIAVGASDQWPAAHYWYYAAVRECSQDVLTRAGVDFDFSDPCFERAGALVESIVEAEPFNEGFLGTSAQQGATSSAGLLANGRVAMELMGHWNPGVMGGLTEDGEGLGEDLGWFPFPTSADGEGDQSAALGGGDGFSCSVAAPPECADFLGYIMSPEVQRGYGATGTGIPTVQGTLDSLEDPNLVTVAESRDSAPFVQLYLDTAYGPNVGGALNDSVALLFAGQAGPDDVVESVQNAGS